VHRLFWSAEASASAKAEAIASALHNPPRPQAGEGDTADKGTTAWHRISAAGAVFPSASVNGQARCIALTPFVPLSREAGEGERAAGRTAARSYTPLPQRGRGAGGEGKKWAPPAHSEPKRCTLIRGDTGGEGNNKCLCVGFSTCPPSQPPPWTGEEPRLPPRPRGGLGWGLCSNLTAKTLTNRASKVHYLPPSFRFPPLREGNRARVRFPLRVGGTLRRGLLTVIISLFTLSLSPAQPQGEPIEFETGQAFRYDSASDTAQGESITARWREYLLESARFEGRTRRAEYRFFEGVRLSSERLQAQGAELLLNTRTRRWTLL
jgi:hypothetical protein